jgi:hypothetical protein
MRSVIPAKSRLGPEPEKAILVASHPINGRSRQPVRHGIIHITISLGRCRKASSIEQQAEKYGEKEPEQKGDFRGKITKKPAGRGRLIHSG